MRPALKLRPVSPLSTYLEYFLSTQMASVLLAEEVPGYLSSPHPPTQSHNFIFKILVYISAFHGVSQIKLNPTNTQPHTSTSNAENNHHLLSFQGTKSSHCKMRYKYKFLMSQAYKVTITNGLYKMDDHNLAIHNMNSLYI